ncbi:hypothetical protein WA1_42690 [Scytonema hofmannii PCC 7110]|uniref:Uncharacterized protein n=1 Tax=Scytonema hofmannii PCC 7110 TaxID=128403 RepID=A0A139WVG0_9CYAN|nr:hypothetical protein [Scytonema hofmannii]KYC36417.1 hypothetical protein WA1_42690 [Scytonema hofmannii PCC 7110]
MNENNEKKFFQVLTSTVGIIGASFLLSLPAFAISNSSSRSVKVSEAPVDTLYSQSQVPEPTGGNTMERMRQGENLNNRNINNQRPQSGSDTGTSEYRNNTTNQNQRPQSGSDTGTSEYRNNTTNQDQRYQGGSDTGTSEYRNNTINQDQRYQGGSNTDRQNSQYNTPSGTQQNIDNSNSTEGQNTNGGVRALW